jgi:hypothetical protein
MKRRASVNRLQGVDGFGSMLTTEQMAQAEHIGGVTDWVTVLFGGKPQSWWSEVDSVQKDLIRVSNDISAIGKETWDNIQYDLAGFASRGEPAPLNFTGRFPGYDFMMSEAMESAKKMLVVKDHVPTSQDISYARTLIGVGKQAVEFAQKYSPEVQDRVAQDRANIESMIADAPLRSPETVGVETFVEDIKRRAALLMKSVGSAAFGILSPILLVGGIALAGFILINMFQKK